MRRGSEFLTCFPYPSHHEWRPFTDYRNFWKHLSGNILLTKKPKGSRYGQRIVKLGDLPHSQYLDSLQFQKESLRKITNLATLDTYQDLTHSLGSVSVAGYEPVSDNGHPVRTKGQQKHLKLPLTPQGRNYSAVFIRTD
jgi:hypothetical protein